MRPLLCLIAAVLLIARTAHADDREEARKAFAEGQTADKAEDWQSAIEHYLHAYELVPHHFALYNIARDYERLGQLREASTWYVRYVEVAPPSGDRDKVQKLLGELKLRPAKLTVQSTPSGARVTIDGQRAGITPYSAQIRGGGHRVAVELDAQRDERDVALEYGEPETVELTLRSISSRPVKPPTPVAPTGAQGTLVVRGKPEGALITIDEVPAGTLPMTIPVAEGQHQIKVTSFGYSSYETTAYVARGADAAVDVNMSRATGGADGPRTIQVGYMIGLGGGADVRGDGALVLGDFGVRVGQGDACLRVGKAFGLTAIDFVIRWAILKTRLSPYVGGGYSYVVDKDSGSSSSSSGGGGAGWEGVAGLRFDLNKGPGTTFSVIAEIGVRTYSSLATSTGSTSGVFLPFMTSIQATFGRAR